MLRGRGGPLPQQQLGCGRGRWTSLNQTINIENIASGPFAGLGGVYPAAGTPPAAAPGPAMLRGRGDPLPQQQLGCGRGRWTSLNQTINIENIAVGSFAEFAGLGRGLPCPQQHQAQQCRGGGVTPTAAAPRMRLGV